MISEIKKASPSKGIICANFDFEKILTSYLKNSDVDAISILTEEEYFLGKPEFIVRADSVSQKPILRKDFIISEKQIFETAQLGADMILLIAAILTEREYALFYDTSKNLGLNVLTEVHNIAELHMVEKYNPELIGVNNRNLKTFEVSLETSVELIKQRKTSAPFISESGIKNKSDIKKLFGVGFKGFLIGETLMASNDINKALSDLQL